MATLWVGKLEVEWNDEKNVSNIAKHGISFAEAATVFEDEHGLYLADSSHSESEQRFLLLGVSARRKMITVVHVERGTLRMRLISARLPTAEERRSYERALFNR